MPSSSQLDITTLTSPRSVDDLCSTKPLRGHVALITGASRGIGREIALTLARAGCNLIIAAKTVTPHPTLPGTIYTVAKEVEEHGVRALAIQCDVRNDDQVTDMIRKSEEAYGKNCIDILVCNSGALWWKDVDQTPMSRYDLVNDVNVRATFHCIHLVLPHMKHRQFGRIIIMSPPIDFNLIQGKVAYSISKFGMSFITMGLSKELERTKYNVSVNSLWPSTLIESYATKNFKMGGDHKQWRKASIVSECCLRMILTHANHLNGHCLIDETYLKSLGVTDFKKYRCVEDFEPAKAWPPVEQEWITKDTKGLPPGVTAFSKL